MYVCIAVKWDLKLKICQDLNRSALIICFQTCLIMIPLEVNGCWTGIPMIQDSVYSLTRAQMRQFAVKNTLLVPDKLAFIPHSTYRQLYFKERINHSTTLPILRGCMFTSHFRFSIPSVPITSEAIQSGVLRQTRWPITVTIEKHCNSYLLHIT